MASSRRVDEAIARFDDVVARHFGTRSSSPNAQLRRYARAAGRLRAKVINMGLALAVLIIATVAFSLFVGPLGLEGLFLVAVATLFVLIFFSLWPGEKTRMTYNDRMPTKNVIRDLDSYLVGRRSSLPSPAAARVDAIGAQLPLLEARLDHADQLDPIAQEARRLMGKHLPELLERYERVPAAFRSERDSQGLTVDERLVAGLDAACEAIDDLAAKLAREDVTALETQGRFIENRYGKTDSIEAE